MEGTKKFLPKNGKPAWSHLRRIELLNDLPSDKFLVACLKEAMSLNDQGIKRHPKARLEKREKLIVPAYFTQKLKKN